jgi:hypothetical protein
MWEIFVETVRRHFHFLEMDFGFVIKSTKPPFVIYESDKLQVLVFYDESRGCELDLSVGRHGDDHSRIPRLGIEKLMRLKDVQKAESYRLSYPCTEEDLQIEVERLATLWLRYGLEVLQGDMRDFERVRQMDDALAKTFRPYRPE